jgi:uncharacterized protein
VAQRLSDPPYLAFPFRMESGQSAKATRAEYVRGLVEQVIFTLPGERVFRPDFGAGARALVFEPNSSAMWQVAQKRILSNLSDALKGEVDPKSIEVSVQGDDAEVIISVAYTLAAIGYRERCRFSINGGM